MALDNDYVTWDNYHNAFWPTKYLIDSQGRLRYTRIGEGNYASFEERIRNLLVEAGYDLAGVAPSSIADHVPDAKYEAAVDKYVTPELYAGFERGAFMLQYYGQGYVGQQAYYHNPDRVLNLEAPVYVTPDLLFFQGAWRNGAQEAIHARITDDFEDYVTLTYSAKSVNAVLRVRGSRPAEVRVKLDGEYLTEKNRGRDVHIGPGGESFLVVDIPRMYEVVAAPTYEQRKTLQLSVKDEGLAVYALTFGIYAEGP